jgi:hypothetical protein
MRRFGYVLAAVFLAWGLAGCGAGIKEGPPPPNAGYTPPQQSAEVPLGNGAGFARR